METCAICSILAIVLIRNINTGGIWSNSLAIATDAAHLLTDFASFMISLFAIWIAGRPSSKKYVDSINFRDSFHSHGLNFVKTSTLQLLNFEIVQHFATDELSVYII